MKSNEKDGIIIIHLFPDEDIIENIKKSCRLHNVKSAVVLSGIGQLKEFKLGYFKEKNNYISDFFNKSHELLSLSGNVCYQRGKYQLHLHAVLGDDYKKVIGGHLFEGKVEVTNEIIIVKIGVLFNRKSNDKTGLMDLTFDIISNK